MSNRTSMKSKIIAIPVNRPEGLIRAQMGDEEVKTEAEERDELINEVKAEEEPVAEPLAIEDAPKPSEHLELRLRLNLSQRQRLSRSRHPMSHKRQSDVLLLTK